MRSTLHRDELIVALRTGGETYESIGRVLNLTRERVRGVYSEATRSGFPAEFVDRFWDQVERGPGCWEWAGPREPTGYGLAYFRVTLRASRVAWELVHGRIPRGLWVLHHCDNPPCVKTEPDEQFPDGHLFLGTHQDNMADMAAKGRAIGPYARSDLPPRPHGVLGPRPPWSARRAFG